MKILKFKKLKNNLYEVLLDGKTISLYEDIILKYELLMRKEISSKDLEQIEQEQHLYECYEKSLQYLNKKMRTKKEMQNYLKKCGYSMKDIDYTIS